MTIGPLAPIACAPDEISNEIFYDAINAGSPRWLVNATKYGHGDYLNQNWLDIIIKSGFCSVKEDWTLNDFITYRDFVGGTVIAFLMSKGEILVLIRALLNELILSQV